MGNAVEMAGGDMYVIGSLNYSMKLATINLHLMCEMSQIETFYIKGCVDLDYLCNFGDPLNHEPVSCHSCVDRKWNSKHGTHHHLLDQLLT